MKALREGQYVSHFQYGLGIVTESNEDRTSIDFDLYGLKKFVTSLMVVELSGLTPPKRRSPRRAKKASASRSSKTVAASEPARAVREKSED
jgi:hypothetical protein